tara:strand:- start:1153 stop:2874 length:1722 start_codon:yes stop_codon:yes gene_type:complete
MNKKQSLTRALTLAMLCITFACNNGNDNSLDEDPVLSEKNDLPVNGGELKLMESQIFSNLLPYSIEENVGYRITTQIHNSLLKMNPNNLNIEPCVARSWEVNDQQTKYTFHLRNNVYFHADDCYSSKEDRKLKSNDVVFTFELLCKQFYSSGYNLLLNNLSGAKDFYNQNTNSISGLKVIDDSTLVFELLEPAPSIIYLLASTKTAIISKLAFEKYGSNITVGCGPFKYGGLNSDSTSIHLTKNKSYFLVDKYGNSLPYLDSVTIMINDGKQNPTELFERNDIMVLYDITENKVEKLFEMFHQKFDDKDFIVDRKSIMGTDCYHFNLSKAPFDNINVRKAFAHAINKNSIIENILNGQAIEGNKGIIPIVDAFNNYNYDTINGYDYNPEKARKLLANAGYLDGKDFPEVVLEIGLGHQTQIEAAKEVQNQLQNNLNILITIEQEEMANLISRAANGEAQMTHFTWLSEYPSPIDFLNLFYGANNPKNTTDYIWPNVTRFENKKYDNILEKALVTSDLKERYRLYADAETVLMNEAPLIPLWYPEIYNITHGYVKNLHFNEMLHFDYSEVYLSK